MDALIELIHVDYAMGHRLAALGIQSSDDLLQHVGSEAQRKRLAAELGVTSGSVNRWADRAALTRVSGLGTLYIDLLTAAGVTTVALLAQADANALLERMVRVNRQRKIARRMPTPHAIAQWIGEARKLQVSVLN